MNFSIGIYSCPMDPIDFIGTTFYPPSNMSGIFLSLSRVENELFHRNLFVSNASNTLGRTQGLYTTRIPVFRWKARGYDWNLCPLFYLLSSPSASPSFCPLLFLVIFALIKSVALLVRHFFPKISYWLVTKIWFSQLNLFLKTEIFFFSVLAFRPYASGIVLKHKLIRRTKTKAFEYDVVCHTTHALYPTKKDNFMLSAEGKIRLVVELTQMAVSHSVNRSITGLIGLTSSS